MCASVSYSVSKLKFLAKEALKSGKIKYASTTASNKFQNGDVDKNTHSPGRNYTHENLKRWICVYEMISSLFYTNNVFRPTRADGRPFGTHFLKFVIRILKKFPIHPRGMNKEGAAKDTTDYIEAALLDIKNNICTTAATGTASRQQSKNNAQGLKHSRDTTNRLEEQSIQINNKIGTWNVCGLGDKQTEIVEYMKKTKIKILGLSDLRRKGQDIKEIHENYVLIWCGTNPTENAKHGVGFIIEPNTAKKILEIDYISDRIISIKIAEGREKSTFIQIYAPCNDTYTEEERATFYDKLSSIINDVNTQDKLYILGDFNGHVGGRKSPWEQYLGPFSDSAKTTNSNGEHILNLCAEHNLIIANTFYQHKRSQILTWYKWNDLNKASQLDFMLVRRQQRKEITDARAMPNTALDTDHKPVVLWRTRAVKRGTNRPNQTATTINLRKLQDKDIQEKIEAEMKEKYTQSKHAESIEAEWEQFKDTLIKITETHCGLKHIGKRRRKQTRWWNEDIKRAVKDKKAKYKIWHQSKTDKDYSIYRSARAQCKKTITRAKAESWQSYGEQLEEICKTAPRDFFRSIKAMRERDEKFNPSTIINGKNGLAITKNSDIKTRWKEYFQELLDPIGQQEYIQFTPKKYEEFEPSIMKEEVENIVTNSKKNKAAGIDRITTEMLLACKTTSIEWLTRIFQMAFEEKKVPEDWQKAIIIPIWKNKGSKRDCGTYRGISLLSQVGKIYAKILESRIRPTIEAQLSNNQFGFRKGKSCTDAIFTMRQLCEKTIEYNRKLNMLFIDQEKAFDRVNRNKLWEILEEYGIKGQLLENIMALYSNSFSAVRTTEGMSEWFQISSGVRQGCVLSPLLYITYMDKITRNAQLDIDANQTDTNASTNELLFADDQCMIYEDGEKLQAHIDALNKNLKEYDMKINTTKTESMSVSRSRSQLSIEINNMQMKQVKEFKYLGSIFTEDGRLDREIEARVQKANAVSYQLAPLLRHPHISINTKRQMINSIFIPTLCYECQTWTLNKTHKQKITTCEMRCLRKITNNTRRDKIPNTKIRERVGTKPCTEFIEKQQMKWFGHLTRMHPDQMAAQVFNSKVSGKRARGRPRKRWIDGVKEACNNKGITIVQATQRAKDRLRM